MFLMQAGIHSGEIDGKDAMLMLIRDMLFKGKDGLLDKVNVVFIPALNADGHERSTPFSRPNQRGPKEMGWRNTAQNLNLNRDFMKAEAPEMQALLGLIGEVRSGFLHRPARHRRHGLPVRRHLLVRWLGRALCRQPGDREMAERRLSPEGGCGAEGSGTHSGADDLRAR